MLSFARGWSVLMEGHLMDAHISLAYQYPLHRQSDWYSGIPRLQSVEGC